MILSYVKFLLVVFITLLREIIIIKAETEEEATELWFSFLYDCRIYARTIEEYLVMAITLGATRKQLTDQKAIDNGVWFPIIMGIDDNDVPLDVDLSIAEYNGEEPLNPEAAEVLGGTDENGLIKPEIRKLIPKFLIASTKNKKFESITMGDMSRNMGKSNKVDLVKANQSNRKATAETVLLDWVDYFDADTDSYIKYSKPLAKIIINDNEKTAGRIVEFAQNINNYTFGASRLKIEETAEK